MMTAIGTSTHSVAKLWKPKLQGKIAQNLDVIQGM
jgi:hypothetical protein